MAQKTTYKQKHEQANREARATVVALAVTILVWIICGFGLAGTDITVFHTPLWVIGGTIGTWICSIVVVVVLTKKIFVSFDLDDEAPAATTAASITASPTTAASTAPTTPTTPTSSQEVDHE